MAFWKIKNYWHRETTLDPLLQRCAPSPHHLCVLKRRCRKYNTNGSGITLNIQMGKLIVYAWITRCHYLASLQSSLKAMQSAFCFHALPLKSFRAQNETLLLKFTAWIQSNKWLFFSFALATRDYCANKSSFLFWFLTFFCGKHPKWGVCLKRLILPPNSWCKLAKFLRLLHQFYHLVLVTHT